MEEEQELCCPNCETVMEQRYHLHHPEIIWYECPICGHRAIPQGNALVTPEEELDASERLHP
jgi:hypothetical protein